MELPNLQFHFFTVLGQQRHELVDYGLRGQSIVGRCVVNLLAMTLDPVKFFLECLGSISEPISTSKMASIEYGVLPPPPRGGAIPMLFICVPGATALVS
jgi:hypothetical protein